MSNLYHLWHAKPILAVKKLPKQQRALVQQIVDSGRMRIATRVGRNFVQLNMAEEQRNIMISREEWANADYRNRLAAELSTIAGKTKAKIYYDFITAELKKFKPILRDEMEKLACLLIQSAESSVIALLLLERAEIFISYDHNIEALLDVQSWQEQQHNSGMQGGASVYVACGGDPWQESTHYPEDGLHAQQRFMVIAAQELGHFADLKRAKPNHYIGRFSSAIDLSGPDKEAAQYRNEDAENITHLQNKLQKIGMKQAQKSESYYLFFKKKSESPIDIFTVWMNKSWAEWWFRTGLKQQGLIQLSHMPQGKNWIELLDDCLKDMAFNLAPVADAYVGATPEATEAIRVAEALARVPQQVQKWGHDITKICYPNLYRYYYHEVMGAIEKII